jgi:hypothetical protein
MNATSIPRIAAVGVNGSRLRHAEQIRHFFAVGQLARRAALLLRRWCAVELMMSGPDRGARSQMLQDGRHRQRNAIAPSPLDTVAPR